MTTASPARSGAAPGSTPSTLTPRRSAASRATPISARPALTNEAGARLSAMVVASRAVVVPAGASSPSAAAGEIVPETRRTAAPVAASEGRRSATTSRAVAPARRAAITFSSREVRRPVRWGAAGGRRTHARRAPPRRIERTTHAPCPPSAPPPPATRRCAGRRDHLRGCRYGGHPSLALSVPRPSPAAPRRSAGRPPAARGRWMRGTRRQGRRRECGESPAHFTVRSWSGYRGDAAPRHRHEVVRGQPEDRVGVTGGGPDRGEAEQVLVDHGHQGPGVADRRHATDREAGFGEDEIGVGALERLPDERGDLALVHAVRSAGDDEERAPGLPQAEHERLRDLVHAAANGARGVGGRPRRQAQVHDLVPEPERPQRLLHALAGRHRLATRAWPIWARCSMS